MAVYNITSDSTLTLKDRVIADFADDDVSSVTFPNDIVNMKTGKGGNTIYSKDETGRNAQLDLRIVRGSPDDRFFQELIQQIESDFASFEVIFGELKLRLGDGDGNVLNDTYTLEAGIISSNVDAKDNVSGDTNQGVSVYNLMFANAKRSIQ